MSDKIQNVQLIESHVYLFVFETGTHYGDQTCLKLLQIHLPLPSGCHHTPDSKSKCPLV